MGEAWRIVKEKYAGTAFSGEGAAKYGGRWNSRGTWVVYTSATRALAALEMLVHLNPPVLFPYVAIRLEFDDALVEHAKKPPTGWQESPAPPATQAIGTRWAKEARSALLALPSVVIPSETNYLLNPFHPDFRRLKVGRPEPFGFDPRLLG